ncbi:Uncharacterised protein [Klebsiella pneumoniae]|nr:Uncharacterised protein [Klebsiella pneumoniae]
MGGPVSDCGVTKPTFFNLPGLGYEPVRQWACMNSRQMDLRQSTE